MDLTEIYEVKNGVCSIPVEDMRFINEILETKDEFVKGALINHLLVKHGKHKAYTVDEFFKHFEEKE